MQIKKHIGLLLFAIAMSGATNLQSQGHISAQGIAATGATVADSLGTWVSYGVGHSAYSTYGGDTLVEEGLQHALWRHILNDINAANIEIYLLDDQTLAIRGSEGKTYVRYRWYRDGQIVAEGNDMHIYRQGNGVPLNGCYHLDVITSTGGQQWQHSDTICIGPNSIKETHNAVEMRISPNPAPAASMATISLSGITTLPVALSIIDASGRYMARHTLTSTIANFSLPSTKGIYLLRLETTDGGTATTKIVVR